MSRNFPQDETGFLYELNIAYAVEFHLHQFLPVFMLLPVVTFTCYCYFEFLSLYKEYMLQHVCQKDMSNKTRHFYPLLYI